MLIYPDNLVEPEVNTELINSNNVNPLLLLVGSSNTVVNINGHGLNLLQVKVSKCSFSKLKLKAFNIFLNSNTVSLQ